MELLQQILTMAGVLVTAIVSLNVFIQYQKRRDKLASVRQDFEKVVKALASDKEVDRLAAAILLRRFFDPTTEAGAGNAPFAAETIDVIAAILRTQDSGSFQKVLADGLRYAPSLRWADLQRTNLRNAYLGSRKRQSVGADAAFGVAPAAGGDEVPLDLRYADFYRADLSNASLKGARADGAVFYQCRMKNTVLRRASLREANFFEADLQDAVFDGALLTDANFEGALNVPAYLAVKLDGARRYRDAEPVVTPVAAGAGLGPRVFVSRPGCLDRGRANLVDMVGGWLAAEGIDAVRLSRPDYPATGALGEVQRLMLGCTGAVVFGFGEMEVRDGVWRRGTTEFRPLTGQQFCTPWSHIEAGMAAMRNLPLLVVAEHALADGIFDPAVSEHHVFRLSTEADRHSPVFADWCAAVRSAARTADRQVPTAQPTEPGEQ